MDINRAFIIVPRLIEQPTWGGKYLLTLKKWNRIKKLSPYLIGQSYELFAESKLAININSSSSPLFCGELSSSKTKKIIPYYSSSLKFHKLSEIIAIAPEKIIGKKRNCSLQILIKLTQAKGNSYQIHVREKDENNLWKYKPECWYFLKRGFITLGIKNIEKIKEYKTACNRINKIITFFSKQIKTDKIKIKDAVSKINSLIKKENLRQYVNLIAVNNNTLIDLSKGGLHHSWEDDKTNNPLGNIVYELCREVSDSVSTIRSYDNGKLISNGSIRKLNIKDYFKYLNSDFSANNPKIYINEHNLSEKSNFPSTLIQNKYYSLDKIILTKDYDGLFTSLNNGFHHLYLKEGMIKIVTKKNELDLTAGHSCFVPACLDHYKIIPFRQSEILKTYIS